MRFQNWSLALHSHDLVAASCCLASDNSLALEKTILDFQALGSDSPRRRGQQNERDRQHFADQIGSFRDAPNFEASFFTTHIILHKIIILPLLMCLH